MKHKVCSHKRSRPNKHKRYEDKMKRRRMYRNLSAPIAGWFKLQRKIKK